MLKKKIVVIGGSAAGAKAAAKARRLDQNAEITIIQKDPDLSMASCGYPYYVGGTFDNRNALLCTPTGVVRDSVFFAKTKDIKALVETECTAINPKAKTISCKDLKTNETFSLDYDKLVITTGARAKKIPVAGCDLDGVTHLLSMQDTDYLRAACTSKEVKKAVIIGGGLIGVEACEALVACGIEVTLVEMVDQVLTFLDKQLAMLVGNHMKAKSVDLRTGVGLDHFVGENGKLTGVKLATGEIVECQLAIMAIGVQPNSELAAEAGLAIGSFGGITVDEYMQTSDADIYAAGDCVEIPHMLTGKKMHMPMGDLANLQGRALGENIILGNSISFPGTIGTAICKIFDFAAGVTGFTETTAQREGIDYATVIHVSPDKPGFMGAKLLISKILVEKGTEKVLGYQCVGAGDVSRQIATAAMAIRGGLTVDDVACADLPYAPPYSLAIDHFIAAAHVVQNKLKGRLKTISAEEVYNRVEAGNAPYFVDGRGPDEHEVLRLGVGEEYIPVGKLRSVLGDLPQDKSTEIVCYCKISLRGYEVALILEAHGYTDVKVMDGGIMAWPYKRAL